MILMIAVAMINTVGRSLAVFENNETTTGIEPPNAKPIFHEIAVPLARIAVGNRSFKIISSGA
jgi:hypothetical protein